MTSTMNNPDGALGNAEEADIPFAYGWFLAFGDQLIGPLSASQALRMIATDIEPEQVHIWHSSFSTWRGLGSRAKSREVESTGAVELEGSDIGRTSIGLAPPTSFEKDAIPIDDFRSSNSYVVAGLACAIAPIFVVGAAIVRDSQNVALTSSFLLVTGLLIWWTYIECHGVRLHHAEMTVPLRLGIWPYFAWGIKSFPIAGVVGFECWTGGPRAHWFRVNIGRRPTLILLDNLLHHAVLRLALERKIAHFAASDSTFTNV